LVTVFTVCTYRPTIRGGVVLSLKIVVIWSPIVGVGANTK